LRRRFGEAFYVCLDADPFRRQVLFLCGHPIGDVQLREWLALVHRVEWRTYVKARQIAVGPRLHERNIALVIGHAAYGLDRRAERALLDLSGAHTEVLLHAGTDD